MGSLTALPALSINSQESPLARYSKLVPLISLLANQKYQSEMQPLQLEEAQQQNKQRDITLKAQQQAQRDQEAFRQAMVDPSMQGKTIGEIADVLAKAGKISFEHLQAAKKSDFEHKKELADLDAKNFANRKAGHDETVNLYGNVMNMPDEQMAQNWPQIAQQYNAIPGNEKMPLDPAKPLPKQALAQFGPLLSMGNTYFDQEMERRTKAADLAQKENPTEQADIMKGGKLHRVLINKRTGEEVKDLGETKQPGSSFNLTTPDDLNNAVEGIYEGTAPPDITQYSFRDRTAIAGRLHRKGYDLAAATTDWKATQRYVASLNGPQQLRLNQSIASASGLLPKIEGLYAEWKKLAPVSGFKIANHAALVAMRNLPGRPGAVATALDTQIAELTADLGNIYMGGNSPTDQALKLGAVALKSDWNPDAFEEGIRQAKLNVGIRKNSIKFGAPQGMSGETNYFRGGQSSETAPSAQDTGKEIHYKIVNGQLVAQ